MCLRKCYVKRAERLRVVVVIVVVKIVQLAQLVRDFFVGVFGLVDDLKLVIVPFHRSHLGPHFSDFASHLSDHSKSIFGDFQKPPA